MSRIKNQRMFKTRRHQPYGPEEIRVEYQSCVGYHTALINGRFTVAGLYVAAMGFIASAVLKDGMHVWSLIILSLLAMLLTLSLWVVELRTRCLITNTADRGVQIEKLLWGVTEKITESDLSATKYRDHVGFFDRQHRKAHFAPLKEDDFDRPRYPFSKKQMPNWLAKHVGHSNGLDLLYVGGFVFWTAVLVYSILLPQLGSSPSTALPSDTRLHETVRLADDTETFYSTIEAAFVTLPPQMISVSQTPYSPLPAAGK